MSTAYAEAERALVASAVAGVALLGLSRRTPVVTSVPV